jgi:hypothetical protein
VSGARESGEPDVVIYRRSLRRTAAGVGGPWTVVGPDEMVPPHELEAAAELSDQIAAGMATTPSFEPPAGPKWRFLVRSHRATNQPRPKIAAVATKMGWASEQPLRNLCRELGVKDWRDVHPLVAAADPDWR